ncbi:MAG: peptidoglycan DD-metalloendopeptidase family protein [Gammaproteobacteria bacterium]|nr:peptidoglycan DD-metalloendopeptidase family protein [Gammaproteobacteria bacterium]
MNYNNFLNNSSKFKNKNRYRLENKKKSSRNFLIFSVMSVAVLAGLFTLSVNSKETTNNTVNLTAVNATSDSDVLLDINNPTDSTTQSIPLDLPEIGYRSEVLAKSVTYIENQPEEKVVSKPEQLEEPVSLVKIIDEVETTDTTVKNTIKAEEVLIQTVQAPSVSNNLINNASITTPSVTKIDKIETVNHQISTPITQTNSKTVIVKSGDTLSAIFKRLSLSASTLHQIINSSKKAKQLTRIRPGQKLVITFDENDKLQSLQYALDRVDTLVINKDQDSTKFISHIESKEIEIKQQFATGKITNSLFATGNKVGLSNAMIMQLAQLFGWDIDFALDIRKGDSFAILFEEKYIDDHKIGNGNILSAEFVNRGKTFKAIRYTDASGHTDYYSEKGLSMRKAFLRTPVDFSRISSKFSSGRKHPVLNRIRAHKGVDYAASRGTPIKAVGDGKVIFKGTKGGYGRVIILQHGSKYTTLYAHMNSYNKKLRHGTRVKQGQIIGYVGSSGLATGPHLHYEFRMHGVHRNPLTVPLPSASPIAKKYRTDFRNTADTLISQLKSRQQEAIALTEQ